MALPANGQLRSQPFDKRGVFRAHPFFKDLDASVIDQFALHAVARKVKKSTVIFRKGEVGSTLYAVTAGSIRISSSSEDGKDTTFNLILPGQIFGEISCFDGRERTASAVAIEDSELIAIERRDFMHLLREHPEVAVRLIEVLCGRLRHTSEQVEDIVFLGLPERLAKVLLYLHRRSPEAPARDKIRVTQREISQMIGASRESANKQLRSWERKKWLKLERGGLIILAPDALNTLLSDAGNSLMRV
ncbi:MAG TPA: Crp/Fnr family transcriptional regulator [Pseudolabrys sp.]|nr:Crp/Fnr family transcriptional regulator [Pseudolabrys sp.]